MGSYGDPDALDALAAELSRRARDVQAAADEQRAQVSRARWVSAAASAYRETAAADCAAVEAAADQLDEAAAVLRRHADEVRQRLAAIARAEAEVRSWLGRQAAQAEHVVGEAAHLLGALPAAGAEAWVHLAGRLSGWGL